MTPNLPEPSVRPTTPSKKGRVPILIAPLFFLLGWVLALQFERRKCYRPHPEPTPVTPPYKVPDSFNEQTLPSALNVRLVGTPANGVPLPAMSTAPAKIIWVDGMNEVLVHLDSTQVRILDGLLLVSIDLETDQTGRTPLVCTYALSTTGDEAGLVATTDQFPRGNGGLAATWGQQLQQGIWSSVLSLANDHATERDKVPRSILAAAGKLSLNAGAPLISAASAVGQAKI